MEEYYQNNLVKIYRGNCLDIIPKLDIKASAAVADPPYELGFMGKSWDSKGVSFQKETWQIIRNSCKSGAMLLSFGGTRTFHRIAVAIENAGWEFRDTIMWIYGSGFPKSLDISKAIDKQAGAERKVIGKGYGSSLKTQNIVNKEQGFRPNDYYEENDGSFDITSPSTPEAKLWDGYGTALKPAWENITIAQNPLTIEAEQYIISLNLRMLEAKIWSLLPVNVAINDFKLNQAEYEGVCDFAQMNAEQKSFIQEDLFAQMGMLQFVSVINLSLNTVSLWRNIWEEALKLGNTYTIGTEIRQIIELKTLNSLLAQTTPESLIRGVTIADGIKPDVLPVGRYLTGVMEKLNSIRTLSVQEHVISSENGLNLRPNCIPIALAMNPLDGTFANNALKHGVAGINIDGCRVPYEGDVDPRTFGGSWKTDKAAQNVYEGGYAGVDQTVSQKGRFPANIIHDGSQMVMELFPDSKGMSGGGTRKSKSMIMPSIQVKEYSEHTHLYRNDNGTAARFFYCAKASKSERNRGCEELEDSIGGGMKGTEDKTLLTGSGNIRNNIMKNNHPTVKPLALMEYLCKLVKYPEYNLILDPFMGSGTTLLACIRLGIPCIGIELDEHSCEIAVKRCEAQIKEFSSNVY